MSEPDRLQQILWTAWCLYRLNLIKQGYADELKALLPKAANNHTQVNAAVNEELG